MSRRGKQVDSHNVKAIQQWLLTSESEKPDLIIQEIVVVDVVKESSKKRRSHDLVSFSSWNINLNINKMILLIWDMN